MEQYKQELRNRIEMIDKLIQNAKELDKEQISYLEGRKSAFEDSIRILNITSYDRK